jgi:hypothetical protein
LRHGGERIAGDIERVQEILPRRIDVTSLQLFLIGISDRVDDKINFRPFLGNSIESGVEAPGFRDVTWDNNVRANRCRQWLNPPAKRFTLIGESELGAVAMQKFSNSPGNRMIVGDAHDKPAFAGD